MTFSLIDTHCHLDMDEFKLDRSVVIKRAQNAGVQSIITIGSDMESNREGLRLSKKYDCVYSSIGIHPHDAKDFTDEIYKTLKIWIDKFRIQNTRLGPHSGGFAWENESPKATKSEIRKNRN